MGSDDFLNLESSCYSDSQVENGYNDSQTKEISSSTSKGKVDDAILIGTQEFSYGSNIDDYNENVGVEDSEHVINMDLEDDFIPSPPALQENIQLNDSFILLENMDESKSKFSSNIISTNSVSKTSTTMLGVDESPITGFKRARTTSNNQQPFVRVVYNSLTRESKKKLMELMQQWSQWQKEHQSPSIVLEDVTLESGEDTYFAALHIGSEMTNAVPFWLDSQGIKENIGDPVNLDGDMVPLYDRGFALGLNTPDGSSNPESVLQSLEASRCFNCGSYSHGVKECPKPRDNVAINNARKQHSSKRNQNTASRSQSRYYQKFTGKFDDLKAGVLGPETREFLGIGELDPPPWLHRMRQLGYPPGYLENAEEDEPSGITIFADEEEDTECEDGELPERAEPAPSKKRMIVKFPGINAPIPENADNWIWGAPPLSRPSGLRQGICVDQTIDPTDRWDGLSRPSYSPSSQDTNFTSTPSPHLGRSLSDRGGWQSPVPYENSPPLHSPHTPYPYSSITRMSTQFHNSPTAAVDHRSHERERDYHHRHHHHHHHHHQQQHRW